MTAEEIMQVLRLTAMGRVNHPDQQRLCDALAKLMEEPQVMTAPDEAQRPTKRKKAD